MCKSYLEEGNSCPEEGCFGKLEYKPVVDCSCHVCPPCSACVENPLSCNVCDWEE